jgi:hypothetical protein
MARWSTRSRACSPPRPRPQPPTPPRTESARGPLALQLAPPTSMCSRRRFPCGVRSAFPRMPDPPSSCKPPRLRDRCRPSRRRSSGRRLDAFLHASACAPPPVACRVCYLSTSETLTAVMARSSQRSKIARSVHASMRASSSLLGVSCRPASTRRRRRVSQSPGLPTPPSRSRIDELLPHLGVLL